MALTSEEAFLVARAIRKYRYRAGLWWNWMITKTMGNQEVILFPKSSSARICMEKLKKKPQTIQDHPNMFAPQAHLAMQRGVMEEAAWLEAKADICKVLAGDAYDEIAPILWEHYYATILGSWSQERQALAVIFEHYGRKKFAEEQAAGGIP